MLKKDKKMKISESLEEFCVEFNIHFLLGLRFVEDNEVNLAIRSLDKGKLFFPKSYF